MSALVGVLATLVTVIFIGAVVLAVIEHQHMKANRKNREKIDVRKRKN